MSLALGSASASYSMLYGSHQASKLARMFSCGLLSLPHPLLSEILLKEVADTPLFCKQQPHPSRHPKLMIFIAQFIICGYASRNYYYLAGINLIAKIITIHVVIGSLHICIGHCNNKSNVITKISFNWGIKKLNIMFSKDLIPLNLDWYMNVCYFSFFLLRQVAAKI